MKIISWNVAGLRACLNKGFDILFEKEKADIYCLQETKVIEEQNPYHPYGYNEYLNKNKKRGYSGTMIYSKVEPISVKYGIDDEEYDSEGRIKTILIKQIVGNIADPEIVDPTDSLDLYFDESTAYDVTVDDVSVDEVSVDEVTDDE